MSALRRIPQRRALLALVASVALLPAACSSGDEEGGSGGNGGNGGDGGSAAGAAEVPDGFKQVDAESVQFAVPEDWQESSGQDPEEVEGWLGLHDYVVGEETVAQAGVLTSFQEGDNDTKSVATGAKYEISGQSMPEGEAVEMDIEGLDDAFRHDYTYPMPDESGNAEGSDIAVNVDGGVILFRITSVEGQLDDDVRESIVESLSAN